MKSNFEKKIREPKTKYMKVRCEKCKNEQMVFSNPSTKVECLVCKEVLVLPSGGKGKILDDKCRVLEVLE